LFPAEAKNEVPENGLRAETKRVCTDFETEKNDKPL